MNKFIEAPVNATSLVKRKLLFGVGINDAPYKTGLKVNGKATQCPYYGKWRSMLNRCYSAAHQRDFPSYIGCTVCVEWLTFSVFRSWMIKQDWYGKQLDKDILIQGNKVYSPSTCLFVTGAINSLLLTNKARRGKYPQGVSFSRSHNKYQAHISFMGKSRCLGFYDTVDEAFNVYKKEKYKCINEVAVLMKEPLRSALIKYRVLR